MNEVMILGRLGNDAELTYSQAGSAICKISVATTEKWGDQQKTFWHRITFFGKTAEMWAPQIKKGDEVWIKGKLQPREYTDKNGNKVYTIDIIASWVRVTQKAQAREGGRYAGQGEEAPRQSWQPPAAGNAPMTEADVPF